MIIRIKVFSSLRDRVPDDERRVDGESWDVAPGTTVGQILEILHLPGSEDLIVLVNGHHAERGRVLVEGDVLSLLPPIGGGTRKGPCLPHEAFGCTRLRRIPLEIGR